MDARAPAGLFLRGARAPGSRLRDPRCAVPRGAAPALGVARALLLDNARRRRLPPPAGERPAAAPARADRAARRRRDAQAARRRHASHALGELSRRAGARAAVRLRLARPPYRDAARRPPVRRRHAARGGPCLSARHRLASPPAARMRALSLLETRVLGTLYEKQRTVPDSYPLTLNALVSGANQKTSRSPVMEVTESEVQAALDSLKSANLVMETSGGRVSRYSHNIERVLQVPSQSVAILTVLMLRGPQTAGELRINCERLHSFADISAVEGFLEELAARPAGALVVQLPRLPGSRENRWAHLLSGAPKPEAVEKDVPLAEPASLKADVARLESELAALKELVARIAKQLGISCLLLALLWLASPTSALAQADFPNRALRLIVTVPPGGAADFIARLVGWKLADLLGQPVLVENRAGASRTIAADAVAKAPPGGYTLLQNSITTHGIGPHLFAKLPYDPVQDFAPVSGLALLPLIMAMNAELPVKSLADL